MIVTRSFLYITTADFLVRSAYQMGKTPLLPVFAASLGAGEVMLASIVSVSVFTGLLFKPLIGILSDLWGRRVWILIGTAFFIIMPFTYRFIQTPDQLLMIRLIHGLATAIYGPVTLAFVSEQGKLHRAERLSWFSLARNSGYVIGPAVAGWLLLSFDPVAVFTIIGLLSSFALIPVLLLKDKSPSNSVKKQSLTKHTVSSLITGGKTPAVWMAGGMEAVVFIAIYATKTFMPIFALSAGVNLMWIGAFFAIQEASHIIINPIGGKLGDRFGYLNVVPFGMLILALSLSLLVLVNTILPVITIAVFIGVSQALVFPSTIALVGTQIKEKNVATGMGLVGTMKNSGKIGGPVLAGSLIHWLDYPTTFQIIGAVLLVSAALLWTFRCSIYNTSDQEKLLIGRD